MREDPPGPPLISIIIPTFNWSSVLRLAIRSVLMQSETNFELLVMGDGCTDDSEDVVKSFGDVRIHWHNLPVNSGHQTAPNNAGLALARGTYVAMLGHDDLWHPDHLRTMRSAIERERGDFVSAWTEMIGPPGSRYRIVAGVYLRGAYDAEKPLAPSGLMFRRDAARAIGGWMDYRTIPHTPDLDFVRRALAAGFRFVSTRELTVFKFASSHRRNSYVEKPCHEQAAQLARIESRRWFMPREVLAIARAYSPARRIEMPQVAPPPGGHALGWEVTQYRRFRGLE